MSKLASIDYEAPSQARPSGPGFSKSSAFLGTLGWSVFLGISWTWCIGMFLPVLLIRDFGPLGWVAFAVPNVIGAAAMGFVLRDANASARMVSAHRDACAIFSLITIAFHVFFVIWISVLFPRLFMVATGITVIVFFVRRDRSSALATLLLSACCLLIFVMGGEYSLRTWNWGAPHAIPDLLKLTPVMCFGFALCPYLDLTFHRARQATSRTAGRLAFLAGFGIVFLLMILFSFLYGQSYEFERFLPMTSHSSISGLSLWDVVAIHLAVQSGFTMAAHGRSLIAASAHRATGRAWVIGATLVFAAALGIVVVGFHGRLIIRHFELGELLYRTFMAFYGLIFPAYVWLCMMPGRGRSAPNPRQGIVTTIALIAAAPMFWLGFIERRMIWLLPGLAVVLLSRLFIPRRAIG